MSRQAWLLICAAAVLALVSTSSPAEGGCPAGMYPIYSPGVVGCAPMPVAPEPRWASRWGAIARNKDGLAVAGVAEGERSEARATKVALKHCKRAGGTNCQIVVIYSDKCFVSAMPTNGNSLVGGLRGSAEGHPLLRVRELALDQCQAMNNMPCDVEYEGCSLPERVR